MPLAGPIVTAELTRVRAGEEDPDIPWCLTFEEHLWIVQLLTRLKWWKHWWDCVVRWIERRGGCTRHDLGRRGCTLTPNAEEAVPIMLCVSASNLRDGQTCSTGLYLSNTLRSKAGRHRPLNRYPSLPCSSVYLLVQSHLPSSLFLPRQRLQHTDSHPIKDPQRQRPQIPQLQVMRPIRSHTVTPFARRSKRRLRHGPRRWNKQCRFVDLVLVCLHTSNNNLDDFDVVTLTSELSLESARPSTDEAFRCAIDRQGR